MSAIRILIGLALLALGRKLFWLFVGGVGFLAGIGFASQFFHGENQLTILVIALLAGLLGAILAVFLQGLAVAIAGFLIGGYLLNGLLDTFGWNVGSSSWLPFIIGGIVGAILVVVVFDWALIILSSLAGSSLIVQTFHTSQFILVLAFIVLFAVGVAFQAQTRDGSRPRFLP